MGEEHQAGIDARNKVIARIYYGKEGGQPAYKTWLEAKVINPHASPWIGPSIGLNYTFNQRGR